MALRAITHPAEDPVIMLSLDQIVGLNSHMVSSDKLLLHTMCSFDWQLVVGKTQMT